MDYGDEQDNKRKDANDTATWQSERRAEGRMPVSFLTTLGVANADTWYSMRVVGAT